MPVAIPPRILWPSLLSSGILFVVCGVMAVFLYRQQAEVAELLRENLASSRTAADVKENLNDLLLVHRDQGEHVGGLHLRIRQHLDEMLRQADIADERSLAMAVDTSYRHYLRMWDELPPQMDSPEHRIALKRATDILESETLPRSQELQDYNNARIEGTAQQHRRLLQVLSWGIGAVGVTGVAAGLFLGYGVARGLRRSIRRLQVQIHDTTGKLTRSAPEIVLTGEGDFTQLQEQMRNLSDEVGKVVEELQQREREVLRAEQLAAVGQLAAGVAHEIRNPLTAIKMLVQAAQAETDTVPLRAEDLEVIEHEIRRIEGSLQTFLDFARPAKPHRRSVDLSSLIMQTFDLMRGRAAKQGVRLSFDPPLKPVIATVDSGQIRQVLVNIAMNALDVMPTGGEFRVWLSMRQDGGPVIDLTDSGPGIAADMMPRLFQPFVSGKETGLGLGLVISRRIVEQHDGTLTARNRLGGGAFFSVNLPPEAVPEPQAEEISLAR